MATNYANYKLSTAIKNHLLSVDVIPPNEELTKLAGELAQVCVTELNMAGLDDKTVENLFAPLAHQAEVRGVH
jgi:hypothetical protein